MKRLIIGISGASRAIYGIRLLEVLRGAADLQTHVVLSPAARRTLTLETDVTIDYIHAIVDTVYRPGDVAAAISSGSLRAEGMIIAPCGPPPRQRGLCRECSAGKTVDRWRSCA